MQIHAVSVWKSVKFAVKMTNERKMQFIALRLLSVLHVTYKNHIITNIITSKDFLSVKIHK